MALSKRNTPNAVDLIDWLNAEGLLDLDWDFPEDGSLTAEMDDLATAKIITAIEDEYGVATSAKEAKQHFTTPAAMAAYIGSKLQ